MTGAAAALIAVVLAGIVVAFLSSGTSERIPKREAITANSAAPATTRVPAVTTPPEPETTLPPTVGSALPPLPVLAAKGETFLLLGTDTRSGRDNGYVDPHGVGGQGGGGNGNSDVIVLVSVDRSTGRTQMVSIHRDLKVSYRGATRKINAAYAMDGPSGAVNVVEQVTGVRVDHVVIADFKGVADGVDALGGIDVCLKRHEVDPWTGLNLAAGCHHLDGASALAYARSRHVRFPDSNGAPDDDDFGRMRRVQAVLIAAAKKASGPSVLGALPSLVPAVRNAVQIDDGLSWANLVTLATAMSSQLGGIRTAALPVENHSIGGVAYVELRDVPARQLLDQFRAGTMGNVPVREVRDDNLPSSASVTANQGNTVG